VGRPLIPGAIAYPDAENACSVGRPHKGLLPILSPRAGGELVRAGALSGRCSPACHNQWRRSGGGCGGRKDAAGGRGDRDERAKEVK
jgi:hypothetical protein